jgi:hypothetical protein
MAQRSQALLIAQYRQIIDTIRLTRERIHKLILTGVIGMPSALAILKLAPTQMSQAVSIELLLAMSPVIVVAFGFAYQSERLALRRYGQYVQEFFDPIIESQAPKIDLESFKFRAWESVVKEARQRSESNSHERFRNSSIFCVLVIYSLASCVISTGATVRLLPILHDFRWAILLAELILIAGVALYSDRISKIVQRHTVATLDPTPTQ